MSKSVEKRIRLQKGEHPYKDVEYDGVIKNWDYTPQGCVFGYVYGDKKGRWPDGNWIRTSKIVKVDEKEGVVYTLNSVYKLEDRDEGSVLAKLSANLIGGTS